MSLTDKVIDKQAGSISRSRSLADTLACRLPSNVQTPIPARHHLNCMLNAQDVLIQCQMAYTILNQIQHGRPDLTEHPSRFFFFFLHILADLYREATRSYRTTAVLSVAKNLSRRPRLLEHLDYVDCLQFLHRQTNRFPRVVASSEGTSLGAIIS
jgi:hypothetical protein